MTGTVKCFFRQKGYGFITMKDGTDIFVHYSDIVSNKKFKTLEEEQIVEFEVTTGLNGKGQAVNVTPVLTVSMVVHELAKEKLHISRLVDDKGKHGWKIVDEKENVVVDKEMNLIELAAYVGIDVERLV